MKKAGINLSGTDETFEVLGRLRKEAGYDEIHWFHLTFWVSNLVARIGATRTLEFLTELVAALRTVQGTVTEGDETVAEFEVKP